MSGFGNSAPRGRRAAPRSQTPLAIELIIGDSKHSAAMSEISRTGAKVSGAGPISVGQELTLRAGTIQVLGEVVWSEDDQCAIAFDTPIAADEVGRLRSLANFVTSVSKGTEQP